MPLTGLLEGSWKHLGGFGEPLGSFLGASGRPLRASWERLGGLRWALGAVLGGKARNVSSYSPSWALLGPSWGSPGALVGLSWAVLLVPGAVSEPSWAVLGTS